MCRGGANHPEHDIAWTRVVRTIQEWRVKTLQSMMASIRLQLLPEGIAKAACRL